MGFLPVSDDGHPGCREYRHRSAKTPTTETLKHPLPTVLIRQGLPQPARLVTLNDIAITQMRTLLSASSAKRLK